MSSHFIPIHVVVFSITVAAVAFLVATTIAIILAYLGFRRSKITIPSLVIGFLIVFALNASYPSSPTIYRVLAVHPNLTTQHASIELNTHQQIVLRIQKDPWAVTLKPGNYITKTTYYELFFPPTTTWSMTR